MTSTLLHRRGPVLELTDPFGGVTSQDATRLPRTHVVTYTVRSRPSVRSGLRVTVPYVIVWDLDRTIGLFDALEHPRGAREVTVALRPGIREAVAELDRLGFKQTVLTLASERYAEIALRGSGLHDAFVEVACAHQRKKGDAEGIARLLGIPAEERQHRMLFVGDHPLFDVPNDNDVVFHLEPNALRRHAKHVVALATTMRDAGGGSLGRGFAHLLGAAKRTKDGIHGLAHDVLGTVLMVRPPDRCPVICFDGAGDVEGGTPVRIELDRHGVEW
jgi:FMN phosphatase YigB (HAD superfamily)